MCVQISFHDIAVFCVFRSHSRDWLCFVCSGRVPGISCVLCVQISFQELVHFMEETGINMQLRFLGYQRREVKNFFTFLNTLQCTLLTNVKKVFVEVIHPNLAFRNWMMMMTTTTTMMMMMMMMVVVVVVEVVVEGQLQ